MLFSISCPLDGLSFHLKSSCSMIWKTSLWETLELFHYMHETQGRALQAPWTVLICNYIKENLSFGKDFQSLYTLVTCLYQDHTNLSLIPSGCLSFSPQMKFRFSHLGSKSPCYHLVYSLLHIHSQSMSQTFWFSFNVLSKLFIFNQGHLSINSVSFSGQPQHPPSPYPSGLWRYVFYLTVCIDCLSSHRKGAPSLTLLGSVSPTASMTPQPHHPCAHLFSQLK